MAGQLAWRLQCLALPAAPPPLGSQRLLARLPEARLPSCSGDATRPCSLLLQGLYHPARKVREVYWRLYNNVYIGAQDALVACYPRMEDEGINSYRRHEMDVFV